MEIPSSDDGTIISLNVKIGDKVSEGDKITEIEIASEKEIGVRELPKNKPTKEIKKKEVIRNSLRKWN